LLEPKRDIEAAHPIHKEKGQEGKRGQEQDTSHGPQSHGPQSHGPQSHGPQSHSPKHYGAIGQEGSSRLSDLQPTPALLFGFSVFYLSQILGVLVLLPFVWNPKACDYRLQIWVIPQSLRLLYSLLSWTALYHNIQLRVSDVFVSLFGIIWFVVGTFWFVWAYLLSAPATAPTGGAITPTIAATDSVCPHGTVYYLSLVLLICSSLPIMSLVLYACVGEVIASCCTAAFRKIETSLEPATTATTTANKGQTPKGQTPKGKTPKGGSSAASPKAKTNSPPHKTSESGQPHQTADAHKKGGKN